MSAVSATANSRQPNLNLGKDKRSFLIQLKIPKVHKNNYPFICNGFLTEDNKGHCALYVQKKPLIGKKKWVECPGTGFPRPIGEQPEVNTETAEEWLNDCFFKSFNSVRDIMTRHVRRYKRFDMLLTYKGIQHSIEIHGQFQNFRSLFAISSKLRKFIEGNLPSITESEKAEGIDGVQYLIRAKTIV